ncbi:MAG: signal peptidase II [Elusimicrobiota bacterium]
MRALRPSAGDLIQAGVIVALLVADRATKLWAKASLEPVREIAVLPFFHLTYVENTGAAWGMLRGRNMLLIVISAILLGALLWMRKTWFGANRWTRGGTVLVAAGALGNLYDRVVFGYVVDFFDFLVWPVFNVADSCITVGACCLAWGLHLADAAERKTAAN